MNVNASLIVKLIAVAAIACVPMSGESFYVELVAKMLLMAIFAMSLDLLVGFTGQVSFGHAAYFGIAAYSVALFTAKFGQMSLWVMLPAAILLSAAAALVIGIFVIRTKGIYFIMVTLAFAQMAYFVFHDTPLGGGSDGVYVDARPTAAIGSWVPFDLDNELHMFYFVLVMMLLVYLFLHRVLQSPFGRVLMGIKSNEHRMQSLGYFTFGYKLAAFTLAGALGGVAGFLYAVLFGFVTPELLSWHESGNVLLMVILGGMGNLAGAVLGAFAFEAMREFFADITKYWQLLMGGVIVALVLFLPGGLTAIPGRIKRALQGGGAK
ncbi:MAG TPA: branched-chain amino acid ABC transporter permease [Thauera sp.]|nr:branched-chain amino acid ABC transporter permease [Thauera sp.]